MCEGRLPVHVDPIRMAETGRILEGTMALSRMDRLAEALIFKPEGDASVRLEFGVDEQGIRNLLLRIKTELVLECQRCLEPMSFPIDTQMQLAMVTSQGEAEMLPSDYEPLLVGDEPLYLQDLVEDELLLSLPIVPRHPTDECPAGGAAQRSGDEMPQQDEKPKDNPFAKLADLKLKR